MFNAERRAQFSRYLTELNSGTPSLTAATNAFGKLSDLDRALDAYLNGRTLMAAVIKPSTFQTPTVKRIESPIFKPRKMAKGARPTPRAPYKRLVDLSPVNDFAKFGESMKVHDALYDGNANLNA